MLGPFYKIRSPSPFRPTLEAILTTKVTLRYTYPFLPFGVYTSLISSGRLLISVRVSYTEGPEEEGARIKQIRIVNPIDSSGKMSTTETSSLPLSSTRCSVVAI